MIKFFNFLSKEKTYRIHYLLFFGLLAFGQLQRFQITTSIAFYGHEIILVSWLLFFCKPLVSNIHQQIKKSWHQNTFLQVFTIFFIGQLLVYNLIDFQLTQILYITRLGVYGSLIGVVLLGLQHKYISKQTIGKAILAIGSFLSLAGLIQYFFFPDTRFLWYLGWDDHYFRLISTLFDPNFSALIIGISFLFYLITQDNKSSRFSNFPIFQSFLTLPFFLLSILLTYSRSGYLALAIGLISLSIIQKKLQPLAILLMLIACIPFLPRPSSEGAKLERTASISSRIESNRESLTTLSYTEVLFGRGLYRSITPSTNGLPQHATAPDNSFIFLFSSLGIIGSSLLMMLLIKIFTQKMLPIESLPILSAILTHSLFNNSLFYIWTISMTILILIYFQKEIHDKLIARR